MTHSTKPTGLYPALLFMICLGASFSLKAQCPVYYIDTDLDGHGSTLATGEEYCVAPGAGYSMLNDDCDDNAAGINSDVTEICNGIDDNCNGGTDEGLTVIAHLNYSGTLTMCSGTSVMMALVATWGLDYHYQFYRNGALIPGATDNYYFYSHSGTYEVSVWKDGGCSATSAPVTINILPLPKAMITPMGSLDICASGNVKLKAKTGVGYTYQWLKDAVAIPGATAISYLATSSGSYTVKVTSSGCSAISTPVTVYTSCRVEQEITSSFSLFPNPAIAEFQIHLSNAGRQNQSGVLSLYNMMGDIVYEQEIAINSGTIDEMVLLPTRLSEGIYLVCINAPGLSYSSRLWIQK